MSIPIFIVVIEKTDIASYSAYTPNIAGLSVTAESREEVERLIIKSMTQFIDRLSTQHTESQRGLELTTAPLLEKIHCLYKYSDSWRTTCQARAQKEGLRFQHWRQLYGHVVDSRQRFKECPLCGEEDPLRLEGWERVRDDGTIETDRDVLDWLKYAQSETTGIKLGFSKGEVAELDAQIDAAWRETVEAEVNRRLAERGLVEVQQSNGNQRQIRNARDSLILTSGVNR